MSNRPKRTSVKLVLLGESAVGKSSIVLRFVKGRFLENHESTIGAAFLTQTCPIPEDPDKLIKFELWDTAGQERFNALTPMYFRNAHAAIVVYDVTDPATLEKAKSWIKELKTQAKSDIVIALTGNKTDLRASESNDLKENARSYARDNNLLFFETSAKTGSNITEMFTDVARYLPAYIFEMSKSYSSESLNASSAGGNIQLRDLDTRHRNEKCAC